MSGGWWGSGFVPETRISSGDKLWTGSAPVLVIAQLAMLADQFTPHARTGPTGLLIRVVWSIAGLAQVYFVVTSAHQWMIWSADSAARASEIVVRFAGRDISLIEFVNYLWSIVLVVVAVPSACAPLRALSRRLRGSPVTAHA